MKGECAHSIRPDRATVGYQQWRSCLPCASVQSSSGEDADLCPGVYKDNYAGDCTCYGNSLVWLPDWTGPWVRGSFSSLLLGMTAGCVWFNHLSETDTIRKEDLQNSRFLEKEKGEQT